MMLLPLSALAQSTEIEIVSVDTDSYSNNGEMEVTVEFRNLQDNLDPSLISVTANGGEVSNGTVRLLEETTVAQGVVLVIDSSGSMEGAPIEAAKTAAKSFVDQKRPEDFIAIVTFSDEVTVLSEFSNRGTVLNERIDSIEAAGGTAMFDGIIRATELFSAADEGQIRKNMIVLTDGADENSTATLDDATAAVQAANIRTFGVALESDAFTPDALQQIVSGANGLFLSTSDPEQLSGLYQEIRRELANTLVLRFNVNEAVPTDVEVAVSYAGLSAQTASVAVPGFLIEQPTETTVPPTTTTVTYAQAQPIIIESNLPDVSLDVALDRSSRTRSHPWTVPVHPDQRSQRRGLRTTLQSSRRIRPRWTRGGEEAVVPEDSSAGPIHGEG